MYQVEVKKTTFDRLQSLLWIVATIVTGWLLYSGYFKPEQYIPVESALVDIPDVEYREVEPQRSEASRSYYYAPPPDTSTYRGFNEDVYEPEYLETYPQASANPPDKLDKIISLIEALGSLILNLSALLIPLITMWMQRKNVLIQTKDKPSGGP